MRCVLVLVQVRGDGNEHVAGQVGALAAATAALAEPTTAEPWRCVHVHTRALTLPQGLETRRCRFLAHSYAAEALCMLSRVAVCARALYAAAVVLDSTNSALRFCVRACVRAMERLLRVRVCAVVGGPSARGAVRALVGGKAAGLRWRLSCAGVEWRARARPVAQGGSASGGAGEDGDAQSVSSDDEPAPAATPASTGTGVCCVARAVANCARVHIAPPPPRAGARGGVGARSGGGAAEAAHAAVRGGLPGDDYVTDAEVRATRPTGRTTGGQEAWVPGPDIFSALYVNLGVVHALQVRAAAAVLAAFVSCGGGWCCTRARARVCVCVCAAGVRACGRLRPLGDGGESDVPVCGAVLPLPAPGAPVGADAAASRAPC